MDIARVAGWDMCGDVGMGAGVDAEGEREGRVFPVGRERGVVERGGGMGRLIELRGRGPFLCLQ